MNVETSSIGANPASTSPAVAGQPAELLALLARAVDSIDGCDTASITLRKGPNTFTAAAHDLVASDLDDAQYEEDSGPALTALRSLDAIGLSDIRPGGGRYEAFRTGAGAVGVRSTLSSPFQVSARMRGSFNLYSFSPEVFGPEAERVVAEICSLVAAALAEQT